MSAADAQVSRRYSTQRARAIPQVEVEFTAAQVESALEQMDAAEAAVEQMRKFRLEKRGAYEARQASERPRRRGWFGRRTK
jgi:hypothetical protein